MGRPRYWLTVNVPGFFAAWLLRVYRRPLPFLLGLGILPVVCVLGLTYQVNTDLWRRQTLHNLRVTARLAAEIVRETLEETLRFEQILAAQPGFGDELRAHEGSKLTQRLQQALTFMPRVDQAMVLTPHGEVIAAYPNHPGLVGSSLAEQEPFRGVRQGHWRAYVSAVYLREGPKIEKVVAAMWPVTQGDQVIGFLQAQHRVEEIKSWLQKIRIEPQGFLYVVDHQHQLAVYPLQVLPGWPKVVSNWGRPSPTR